MQEDVRGCHVHANADALQLGAASVYQAIELAPFALGERHDYPVNDVVGGASQSCTARALRQLGAELFDQGVNLGQLGLCHSKGDGRGKTGLGASRGLCHGEHP